MKTLAYASLAVLLAVGSASAQQAGSGANAGASSGASAQSFNVFEGGKSYRGTGGAFAPGLAAGAITCQGSASMGAGGPGFSFAFGATKMDKDCNTRANAVLAGQIAGNRAAQQVACNIDEIADALVSLGLTCYKHGRRGAVRTVQVRERTVAQPVSTRTVGSPRVRVASAAGAVSTSDPVLASWCNRQAASARPARCFR